MNERKQHRHFITLNSRARRHNSLPYILPQLPRCLLAHLTTNELQPLLNYLSLLDLTRLHEALHRAARTKEAAKAVVAYIARSERIFSVFEQKEFMGYIVLRKRKLSKWRGPERQNDRFEWERINWDVDRTHVWFCRSREQVEHMRTYLRRVLYRLCTEVARFSYVQGFHCIVKAMFESRLSEQEAYLLGCYLLREMRLGRYYDNRLERMRELCYVLDVYVYNNLPQLHYHLKRFDLTAQCYALSWFLTLYSQQLPNGVLSRLWVLFLLKGWKVLIKFGVALLCAFQSEIFKRGEGELPEYLRELQSQLSYGQERQVWQLYCSIKVTNKMVGYLSRQMHHL